LEGGIVGGGGGGGGVVVVAVGNGSGVERPGEEDLAVGGAADEVEPIVNGFVDGVGELDVPECGHGCCGGSLVWCLGDVLKLKSERTVRGEGRFLVKLLLGALGNWNAVLAYVIFVLNS
jgi:hypothetical protein